MAQLRGFCNDCYSKGGEIRTFEVVRKNKVAYCPKCGKMLDVDVAIDNYKKIMNELYEQGEYYLYKACDYENAWRTYSKIINADPSDVYARYGRILTLLFSSTLRNNKFQEIEFLFKEDRNKYLRSSRYYNYYFTFLKIFNNGLCEYLEWMNKNLAEGGYFYEFGCVKMYYIRLIELKKMKQIVCDEMLFLTEKDAINEYLSFREVVENELGEIQVLIKSDVTDVKGVIYKCGRIGLNGKPLVGQTERREIIKRKFKNPNRSIDGLSGTSTIPDKIFKKKKVTYQFTKFSIPVIIGLATLFVASFVMCFVVKPLLILWIILGGLSLVGIGLSFTLRMIWLKSKQLSSYLLMKPFRHK